MVIYRRVSDQYIKDKNRWPLGSHVTQRVPPVSLMDGTLRQRKGLHMALLAVAVVALVAIAVVAGGRMAARRTWAPVPVRKDDER